jgi:hypothetical protein
LEKDFAVNQCQYIFVVSKSNILMDIQGYEKVNYPEFQKLLWEQYAELEMNNVKLAALINVTSSQHVKNIFKPKQIVSDNVLTCAMKALKVDGFVLWMNGKRFYYVKQSS